MRPAQIFISYRRDDAAGYARAVYDELAERFGADRIFIDVDDIGAGQPFGDVIRQAVVASKVLLVLMGRRWLGEREDGLPRIAEPDDFVRLEVAAGLAGGVHVIPVLLDGATMPAKGQLPEVLQGLTDRNAIEIDNRGFAADIDRLAAALQVALGAEARRRSRRLVPAAWGLGAALLIAVAGMLLWRTMGASRDVMSERAAVALAPPAFIGTWQADVTYDWPNAHHVERFVFAGDAGELHGSASFLGVPRGIADASLEPGGLRFATRTGEIGGADTVHRYRGRWSGSEIRFVMQTEGGSTPHVPVEFVARRVVDAAASAASP